MDEVTHRSVQHTPRNRPAAPDPLQRNPLIAAGLILPASKRVQPTDFDGPSAQGWITERDDNPEALVVRDGPGTGGVGPGKPEWRRPWPTLRLDHETRSSIQARLRAT